MDVFPTMIDLCELKTSEGLDMDGVSFKTALIGNEIPGNEKRSIVVSKFVPDKDVDFFRNRFCVISGDWRLVNKTELYNVRNDPAQRQNVFSSHPDEVSKMNATFEEWLNYTTIRMNEPVRMLLGDEQGGKISLTTQDLYGKSVFSQGQVEKLLTSDAPWKVTFVRDGRYRFTLSRFPLYTGYSFGELTKRNKDIDFDATNAKVKVRDQFVEKSIKASDSHVVFELVVKAGDTDLQTWLTASDGTVIPAYFVNVEIIN